MNNGASENRSSYSGADSSPFEALRKELGNEWPAIVAARTKTVGIESDLRSRCESLNVPQNTAIVAFGSLARREWTSGSDVDWSLLIDGPADPEHFRLVQDIAAALEETPYAAPGATGTFGAMSSSHELIHHIGGLEDTNQNLTKRILLLLESCCLTESIIHERVVKGILKRYIVCDPGVSSFDAPRFRVPRFLLNDIVRYWRTVAVDYATKKWQQQGTKWALRNVKLRMPRMLFFVKGLLMCFDCELNPSDSSLPDDADAEIIAAQLSNRCFSISRMTPLDVLCMSLRERAKPETSIRILSAYDTFLGMLDDQHTRKHLECLGFENASDDTVFQQLRATSHEFRDGMGQLFFDEDADLMKLTRRYGVF